MMKTEKIIGKIIIFAVVLLMSGCEGMTGLKTPISERYEGTQGVMYSYIENMPPEDKAYEQSIFKTGITIENKGANTAKGFLSIGYEPTLIELKGIELTNLETGEAVKGTDQISFELLGKGERAAGSNGQKARLVMDLSASSISLSQEQKTKLDVNLCYQTKTTFIRSTCIDPDIYSESKREKACKPQDITDSNGQGAPISITKIETRMIPEENDLIRPSFTIYVNNEEKGIIINKNSVEQACKETAIGSENFGVINLKASLDGQPVECILAESGTYKYRQDEYENKLQCRASQTYNKDDSASLKELKIEMEYGYQETKSKMLTILKNT